MNDSLNNKQRRFVDEYMIDLDAKKAAVRAGYAKKSAQQSGSRLLRLPAVKSALDAAMEDRSRRTRIIQDQVIEELAAIAFCDPAEIATTAFRGPADIARLPERARRLIAAWGYDARGHFMVKLHPKLPALEALARHLGLFVDRKRVDMTARLTPASEPLDATARWLEEVLGDASSAS
jgi:phage terminase small subunit